MRAGCWGRSVLLIAALWCGSLSTSRSAERSHLEHATEALQLLLARYPEALHVYRDGHDFHAWQRFVVVSSLAEYEAISGESRFRRRAASLLSDRRGLDGNDDDLWVAEAALDVATVQGRRPAAGSPVVADARHIFDRIAASYWDGICGGGVWWDHARTYKNAITNELFMDVAARLYAATGTSLYRAWALKSWVWFHDSGMINPSFSVNDGLDARCHNNGGPAYSYNQGVILDGLLHLAAISPADDLLPEAARIGEAAIAARGSSADGFREAQEPMSVDSRIFRGIFVRALGHLVPALPDGGEKGRLAAWLSGESARLWDRRHGRALFSADWRQASFTPSAQAQVTAADLFMAAARAAGEERP